MKKSEIRLLQHNCYPRNFLEAKFAGPKAVRDARQILKGLGFADLCDASSPSRIIRVARQLLAISFLKKGQVLLVQYPISRICIQYLSLFKGTKKIALVHDTESIRAWKINGGGYCRRDCPLFSL